MKGNNLFNEKMKLADLLLTNPSLLLLLSRFNIPFGFGNKKVAEVCKRHNIPANFFIMICNVYSFNDYLPTKDEIIATDMHPLVKYLEESHKYYLAKRIPHIGEHLKKITSCLDSRIATVLTQFFNEYLEEVSTHFHYEEQVVFPYLDELCSSTSHNGYQIGAFTKAHTNIEDKLDDLTQIVFKYLPESIIPDEAVNIVFDILRLSEDIKKHSLIEEKILVPYVEYLEHQKSHEA